MCLDHVAPVRFVVYVLLFLFSAFSRSTVKDRMSRLGVLYVARRVLLRDEEGIEVPEASLDVSERFSVDTGAIR